MFLLYLSNFVLCAISQSLPRSLHRLRTVSNPMPNASVCRTKRLWKLGLDSTVSTVRAFLNSQKKLSSSLFHFSLWCIIFCCWCKWKGSVGKLRNKPSRVADHTQ